jgi:alginate O-acetyltransferase complex protein AlgI
MTTNSFAYLVFVGFVFISFYLVKGKYRWALLLLASMIFYASQNAPYLLLVLALVILISYYWGLRLEAAEKDRQKQFWLISGILLNLIFLFFFRYLPVIVSSSPSFSSNPNWSFLSGVLTIGVSFFVLQAISYLIDIYLEVLEPERHLGTFALYLSFFPKLIQGPIERGGDLLPQLNRPYQFDYQNMRRGLWQIELGLFKKLVIADRLAVAVNAVYNNVQAYTGIPLIIATYLYALQIYFDFSAYTDIALGVARLFGINLTQNFNSPYLADSIPEFWRRWHISFSRWILDFIFKPLQMFLREWKQWGSAAALMITFLLSGIWHGLTWGFIVWGLLHGIYMAASVFFSPFFKKLFKRFKLENQSALRVAQVFITFNLVSFTWIFFRARTLTDAFYVATHLFRGVGSSLRLLLRSLTPEINISGITKFIQPYLLGQDNNSILILACVLAAVLLAAIINTHSKNKEFPLDQPAVIRWGIYYLLVFVILFLGMFNSYQFIYNQF